MPDPSSLDSRPVCDWCSEPIGPGELVTELRARADDDAVALDGDDANGSPGPRLPRAGNRSAAVPSPVIDRRARATVCRDCYAAALSEPGFDPVAIHRAGDRRLVILPEPAQVGPVDCRYGSAPGAE